VFLSYDYWLSDRGRLENSLYHLAHSASALKIRILPVLFDCCGAEPTEESLNDRDPKTAAWLRSPGSELINDRSNWFAIEDYVNWFMQRWAHEHRMMALEVINEPATTAEFKFARQMFARAARLRKSLPLTFGARRFEDSRLLQDLGLDLLSLHENFHSFESSLRPALDRAAQTQEILSRPVLLTEWQRLRPNGDDDWQPAYATMAGIIREYPLGQFFWSLMLRPSHQGKPNALSGVFHESGAVWSLADARAIRGDGDFSSEEKPKRPDWLNPGSEA